MREILFRARKSDGKWVEGYYVKIGDSKHFMFTGDMVRGLCPVEDRYGVEPETLCQYTGLVDENGGKIFEGDIVAFLDIYSTESGYAEQHCIGKVFWDKEEACFHVTDRLSAESWEVLNNCCIIGNIFDNPEMYKA